MRTRYLAAAGAAVALALSALAGMASAGIRPYQPLHRGPVHHGMAEKAPVHTAAPKVTFFVANDTVNVDERPAVRFAVVNAPQRAAVFLQRAEGTRHVWQNVVRLGTADAHGAELVPGVGIGEWTYRVAVELGNRTLAGSKWRHLYSYGTVSWAQWCNADPYGCKPSFSTIQIVDFRTFGRLSSAAR